MLELTETFRFEGRAVAWGRLGAGDPIVLIHGTPFSSHVWHRIAPWLAARGSVHFFDLLGYGSSEKGTAADVSLGVQNRLLAALLAHWGIEAPTVVAHDFGGATALRAWLLDGLRYRSLFLIDPVVLRPWGSPFVAHVREHEAAFAGMPAYAHRALVSAYIRGAIRRQMPDAELEPYLAPWLGEAGQRAFYAQIARMDRRFTEEIEDRLSEIDCPTTILWGEDDAWLPVEQGGRLAGLIPGAELVRVPRAGHLVQEDAPEAILAALLERIERPAGVRAWRPGPMEPA